MGDPIAMAHMPMTGHGFRLRPIDELTARIADAGLGVRHERLGDDDRAFHLLVASHETS